MNPKINYYLHMKIIVMLLLLFSLSANISSSAPIQREKDSVFMERIIKPFQKNYPSVNKYHQRIKYCTKKYSRKYKLPAKLIFNIIKVESGFRYYVISCRRSRYAWKKAYGLMQIKPYFHGHLLYIVDNGNLGKKLLNQKKPNHKKYFLR